MEYAYDDFRDMISTVLDQSVGVRNMSGKETQKKCTELAVSIPVHRHWLDHLLSLFPDFLHICGISVSKDGVTYESVKEDSVLSLVRSFLDACAFFDIEKYALAFLTNMLLVLDKANHGEAVVSATGEGGFYDPMTKTAFEKAVRRRLWAMMYPKSAPDTFQKKIKEEMASEDPYLRKQVYLALLEMAKKGDHNKGITQLFGEAEKLVRQVLEEQDVFAQAAFVRLLPYLYGDMDLKNEDWKSLVYHAKLALALECHEGQNNQTNVAKRVFEYAREPITINGRKFYSKRLRKLGETEPATASSDPVRDLTDDRNKPYTERLPPDTVGVTIKNSKDGPELDHLGLADYMVWFRSPIYLARERAVDAIAQLCTDVYSNKETEKGTLRKEFRSKLKELIVSEYEIGDIATRHSLLTLLWRLSRVMTKAKMIDKRPASLMDGILEPEGASARKLPCEKIERMVTQRDRVMADSTSFIKSSLYSYWQTLECRSCDTLCRSSAVKGSSKSHF